MNSQETCDHNYREIKKCATYLSRLYNNNTARHEYNVMCAILGNELFRLIMHHDLMLIFTIRKKIGRGKKK